MGYTNAATFDNLRVVAADSLTSSYVQVGTELSAMCVAIAFKNATNEIVYISTDGSNDKIALPSGWGSVYDIRTNAPNTTDYLLPQGTPIFAKYASTAPSTGSLYIECLLAEVHS